MDIKDKSLAEKGISRIEWARQAMPVLTAISERFEKEKPLAGKRIAACLHVTTETAILMQTLQAGGAEIRLCASNPLSTQDDVAAALSVKNSIEVFAIHGEDNKTYYQHIHAALELSPHITMDDGADLLHTIHSERKDLLSTIIGGTEETTTGVIRLKAMAKDGVLAFPVIAVNDAHTKHMFDNRYGTGQSTVDAILRATNRLIAGSTFVVAGYGWCGRGIATRAAGMGANVIITEVNAMRALKAIMDGYRVMPMDQAAALGDFFCTATGDAHVIGKPHFDLMKEGAIVCNAGHFNVEIDMDALEDMAVNRYKAKDEIMTYVLKDQRRIYLLSEGRLVNLSAAEGHPSGVMDMSFANQALSCEYLGQKANKLKKGVYPVPSDIDKQIAKLKLESMKVKIDTLTKEQTEYLHSWNAGT